MFSSEQFLKRILLLHELIILLIILLTIISFSVLTTLFYSEAEHLTS